MRSKISEKVLDCFFLLGKKLNRDVHAFPQLVGYPEVKDLIPLRAFLDVSNNLINKFLESLFEKSGSI